MFIVPISTAITPLNTMSQNETAVTASVGDQPSFKDVFTEVLSDVQETQAVVNEDAAKLVMGEIDDLHTVYNNMTKAAIALETFVTVKDTVQQAYNEIMQMGM